MRFVRVQDLHGLVRWMDGTPLMENHASFVDGLAGWFYGWFMGGLWMVKWPKRI